MGNYLYEFERFGCLFRKKGVTITDALGNYIIGEPHWVWWWPINWIVITVYAIPLMPIFMWRAFKARKQDTNR